MSITPLIETDHDDGAEPTLEEQVAFGRLFNEYFGPLYRYVYGNVPVAEQARDIVNIVFLRVWAARKMLDPGRSVLPFLRTLARFATVDYLRHERIETKFVRRCLHAAELDGPAQSADDPEHEVLRQELAAVVARALEALSPRQREVLLLRWHQQLTYEQIAVRLHISKKTVAMHLARAMERLREVLPAMYDLDL